MQELMISITENAGESWTKVEKFPGVPEYTYVSDIMPSKHSASVVYASFDNRKRDDFKPYILKSTDKGKTWTSIANNLPGNGTVHTLQQDFKNEDLLFAGTEFGVFFSIDGGNEWVQMKAGIPTIAVRDMAIQEREEDLALATFGRGFYILDDYSPLRELAENKDILENKAHIFEIADALMFLQEGGKYGQGATLFHAPNPDFGAVFTYYLKETPKTLKQIRKEKEKELFEEKKPIPQPDFDELRKEENEIPPYLLFTVTDEEGNVVRKITKRPAKGINRLNWDLRYDSPYPVRMQKDEFSPFTESRGGMLAVPGTYKVSLDLIVRDTLHPLIEPVAFETEILKNSTLPRQDAERIHEFNKKLADLTRTMRGAQELTEDNLGKVNKMMQTVSQSVSADMDMLKRLRKIQLELKDILYEFEGPEAKASWEELPPIDMPLNRRLSAIIYSAWGSMHGVTGTMEDNYSILMDEFPALLERIESTNAQIEAFQDEMNDLGIQWTPDRVPSL